LLANRRCHEYERGKDIRRFDDFRRAAAIDWRVSGLG